MESMDGLNYKDNPGEIKIKKAIVNYLEGGIDSFKHKQEIYKSVLSD